jgi:hypothetical protein
LSIVDWLAYPFVWLMDPHRVWELQFRDLRMVALYPAVIAFLFLGWKRARRDSPRLLFVCVFLAVSYVIWLHMFSIYRYLSVVEILAPGVIVALAMFMRCPRRWLAVLVLLLICSQFLIEFPRSPRALHLEPGQTSTLSTLPEGSMVVMDGYEPIAFALLWLDDDIPAVRIRSNLLIKDPPEDGLNLEARRRAREHAGPVFLLHARSELIAPFLEQDLAGVGLHLNRPDDCQPVFMETALQDETGLLLCPLIRQNALPVQLVR